MLLIHTFVPVAETRISILFLARRSGKDSNLRVPKGTTSLAGKRIQPDSATAANSSVAQYCLITTEYKQILTSIIFCLSFYYCFLTKWRRVDSNHRQADSSIRKNCSYGLLLNLVFIYLLLFHLSYFSICRVTLKLNSGLRLLYLF